MKRVLVPGGTGAMGIYLVPELLRRGYHVDVVSLDDRVSDDPNLTYTKADFKAPEIRAEFCSRGYDGIVDFMIYNTKTFPEVYDTLLSNTGHYIYLSSYRIYDGAFPITEESPRLLDSSKDAEFLKTDDYSLHKARGEDVLAASRYDNYTIIRPAITYSRFRFQLVTLEAFLLIYRMRARKTVLLPETARNVQATMTWAGDVAKMIAGLLFHPKALKERYTVATAEHNTWETVASYYQDFGGMDVRWIPEDDFLRLFGGGVTIPAANRYQLDYDRLFNRVVDNSKILEITGLRQSDLTPLRDGLAREYSRLPLDMFNVSSPLSEAMDAYLANN